MAFDQYMQNIRNQVRCEQAFLEYARGKKLQLEWSYQFGYYQSYATEREWQVFKAEWFRKNPLVK